MRLAFALLALLALPTVAAAEPDRKGLTFSGGLEAGSFATEVTGGDDSPSGRSVGAWVAGGQFLTRRLALVLQLRWTTMRDAKIEDPFDEPSSDVRTTWLEGAAAIQGYVLPRLWVGARLAYGTLRFSRDWDFGDSGTAFGARLGVDVYDSGRDAIAIVGDLELIFAGAERSLVPFAAATATVGVAYQFRAGQW